MPTPSATELPPSAAESRFDVAHSEDHQRVMFFTRIRTLTSLILLSLTTFRLPLGILLPGGCGESVPL